MIKTTLHVSLEEAQLQQAKEIMDKSGITLDDAFSLFLSQVIQEGKMPYYITEEKAMAFSSTHGCSLEEILEELDIRR